MSGTHQHPYHLVEPSPWPLVGSISGLITAIGAIMFMHERDYGIFVLSFGLASILFTMFMWWRDVIREAEFQGHHTPIVQIGMRYGMMLLRGVQWHTIRIPTLRPKQGGPSSVLLLCVW